VAVYQLQKLLGEGSLGQVYLAKEKDRQVAIKFLRADLEPGTVHFFREEVRWLSRTAHPNLVRIYDFFAGSDSAKLFNTGDSALQPPLGSPFFVMEYIPGNALDEGPALLDAETWIDRMAQACHGLLYLHERNLFHRDLKPSNLLVTPEGTLKILDFSMAGGKGSHSGLGTLAYMPPEAFNGDFEAPSDLFSLGVSFYQAITGRRPYTKPLTRSGIALAGTPVPLRKLRPEFPAFFSDLLDRLLSLSPSDRPSSAHTVLRYLQQHSTVPHVGFSEEERKEILQKVPLVGREAAWEVFARAEASPSPGPKFLRLSGPTGVGRSRLLEEFKWHYLLKGIPFLTIPAEEAERWLDYLLQRTGQPQAHSENASLFLDLEASVQSLGKKPFALACCDLQSWLTSSVQELRLFCRALERARTPTLVFFEWNQDLGPFDLEPEQETPSFSILLADLNPEQTRQLIREATQTSPLSPEQTEEIVQTSGGRPLLIFEELRQVDARGVLEPSQKSALGLPKRLEEAIRFQWRNLTTVAREVLALILTASVPVTFDSIAKLVEAPPADRDNALLELDSKGILAPRHSQRPWLALSHPSLKEAWASALGPSDWKRAHQCWLVSSMENPATAEGDASLAQILEHALGAEDLPAMRRWGMPAIEALSRMGRFQTVLEATSRLLAIIEDRSDRCGLFAYQAPYFYRLGKYAEALEAYARWYELREDDESLLQRVKFFFYSGLVLYSWGKTEEAFSHLQNCLRTGDNRLYEKLRPYHSRANNLLAALHQKKGEWTEALTCLDQSLGLAQGDSLLLGEAEQQRGSLELECLRWEEAQTYLERSLAHYRETGKAQAEAIALHELGLLAKERGELRAAILAMEAAVTAAKRGGELAQVAKYQGDLGALQLEAGDYGPGIAALENAAAILGIVGSESERWIVRLQAATAYLHLGNWERLEGSLRSFVGKEADLERQSLDVALDLLFAEYAYLQGRPAKDESHPRPRPNSPREDFYRQSLQLRKCLRFSTPLSPETREAFLKSLENLPGPSASAWKRALPFLLGTADEQSAKAFQELETALGRLERPEERRELRSLLSLQLHRQGLPKLAQEIFRTCQREWRETKDRLPEEFKMDYEKNRNLRQLEEALSEESRPAAAPSVTASATPAPAEEAKPQKTAIPENKFRQFCEISRQISQRNDLQEILDRVMDAAIELSGAERGFLLLNDPSKNLGSQKGYEVKAARHISHESLQEKDLQLSFSSVQDAISRGVPLLTDDAQSDARFSQTQSVHQYHLKSILVVPLEIEGRILGAIYLDHRYQPDCFSKEDVVLISGFASQAGLAIRKVQMMEELRRAKANLESQVKDQAQALEVLSTELTQTRSQFKYEYKEIVGKSAPMQRVFQLLDHVTKTKIPVWIWGESGTGKELVARSLHFNSPRKSGPYVSENCSAIPENLLESELFGHKKGAFTHADRDRIGLFEQASGGTLFLDEVADMSLSMQVKLLRVLQEGEIRPLGSNKKVVVDVRLVTASNRDLQQMVKEGTFRQDLFFRINGMTIKLPPLRERKEDIPLLVHYLIKKIAKEFDLEPCPVTKEAFHVLTQYSWPGNIRELEGWIRNLMLFANGQPISRELIDLQGGLSAAEPTERPASSKAPSLNEAQQSERQHLIEILQKHHNDKTLAAKELGISLKSVYARLARLGIPKKKSQLEEFLRQRDKTGES